ncbi:hypothetical protein BsWGS_02402 [Bradybaena similaris]
MADVDENKLQTVDAPAKNGPGRGILGNVLGDKVRGIGRGSVTNIQVKDVGGSTRFEDGKKMNNNSNEKLRMKGSQGRFRGASSDNRQTDGRSGASKVSENADQFRNNSSRSDRRNYGHTNGSSGDGLESAAADDDTGGRDGGRVGRGRGGGYRGGNFRGGFGSRGGHGNQGRDWICPDLSCGNKNFAFRKVCQRCNTPKPESLSG